MKDNYLKGIGSYWAQFFKDRDVLEAYGTASTEMLSAVYTDLSNVVLSISHEDIPVYDRAKWDALVLSASDVEIVDSKYRFPLPAAFNTKGLRRSQEILSSVVSPKVILSQGYDFTIVDELIEFNADPFSNADIPLREVSGDLQITLWCPVADIDTNRIWRNYGHFTKKWRFSSPDYKNFVRGMFHTWMFGPIINRVESGLNLIAGLPVAYGNGDEVVVGIIDLSDRRIIRTTQRDYSVPSDVGVRVNVGDKLGLFQSITDVVEVVDYLIEPGWWQGNVDSLPLEIGSTNDLNEAFDQYLKYNTFLVKINIAPFLSAMSDGKTPFSAAEFKEFVFQFKPSYTYPLIVFSLDMLSLLEISDRVGEDVVTQALDIYTRPGCYKFGFGSEEELLLYYFDRTNTYFDGAINIFTSFPNYNPVPLLYFDQPLVKFDKDVQALMFDGAVLFNAYDWTAITFAGCEEDRLVAISTLTPEEKVNHLPPEFHEDFGFDGQIKWGDSEIPFCDAQGCVVYLENREDIVITETSQAIADYTGESQLHQLFDGELCWDNAAMFSSGPLFAGNELLFDNLALYFSQLPQLSFDGAGTFSDMHGIQLDSGYEQQIDTPAAISYQDQHPYTQFLFDGGFPFDGSEYRIFDDNHSQYDSAALTMVLSYDELADEIDEFITEASAVAFGEQRLEMFNGENIWDDAAMFLSGPLFSGSGLYFNLNIEFGEIAESAFGGMATFGGGSSNVFDSDYGSSAESDAIFTCQDVAPDREVTFYGVDSFDGAEGLRFSADRTVYDSTARGLEWAIEETVGVPDEDAGYFSDTSLSDEYHAMFNGGYVWDDARLFSSGPLFSENGLLFNMVTGFGGLPDFSFGGNETFGDIHPSGFDSGYGDSSSVSVYSISQGMIIETLY